MQQPLWHRLLYRVMQMLLLLGGVLFFSHPTAWSLSRTRRGPGAGGGQPSESS